MLVTVANIYGYGPATTSLGVPTTTPAHPLTEDTPLAAPLQRSGTCWYVARTTRGLRRGSSQVVEIRAADYIGPRADSVVGSRFVPRVLAGRSVTTIGRSDVAHTFTYTEDVARLAVIVGADPRAWGKAWHAPSNEPRTQQEVANDVAAVRGRKACTRRALPRRLLYTLGFLSA